MPLWTFSLEGGPQRVNHAAVAIGDRIFSFGGYCTGEDFSVTKPIDIHVFNTIALLWRKLKWHADVADDDVPYQRYGHTAVALDETVFIWGGRNDRDGSCNVLYCFNTVTGRWRRPPVTGNVPFGRDGHTACLHQGDMLIFGGYDEQMDRFSNEIYSLNLTTFVWSYIKHIGIEPPARWRDFHTASMIGPLMYVFGGRSDRGGDIFTYEEIYCNEVNIFNTRTHEWSRPRVSGPAPLGRRSHSAFLYAGELYILAGYNGIHDKHYNCLYSFNPGTCRWREVPILGVGPCPRRRQCSCLMGSRVFVFGGTGPIPDGQADDGAVRNQEDLLDLSDLHILDFSPSLRTLCMMAIVSLKLNFKQLPKDLRQELQVLASNSTKSRSENTHG